MTVVIYIYVYIFCAKRKKLKTAFLTFEKITISIKRINYSCKRTSLRKQKK